MCYELRFFRSWAKRNELKSTEIKAEAQRTSEKVVPIHRPAGAESAQRKERKRATDEVI